jgi:hypothetical protein
MVLYAEAATPKLHQLQSGSRKAILLESNGKKLHNRLPGRT